MNRPLRAGFVLAPAILLALSITAASGPVKPAIAPKARPLPLSDVRLTGGPLKVAQDRDADYLLSLSPDRMMAFLRKAAGLEPKAAGYGGWDGADRQLTGHIAGHYLSGVSLMYAATGDRRFKERAGYLVAEMKAVQDKHGDGYIGAQTDRAKTPGKILYGQVAAGDIRSSGFDLNGMWSPWYVQHKIFAGLRDAYRFTGSREALEVESRFAAWAERILAGLDDAQIQKMLGTEFGGMNEVLVDLYADTGDRRWLLLADRFDHRAVVEPLARGEDILRGKHGNTQVPKLLGVLARYIATGRPADAAAATFFWERVALHHSFATGGHGRNEYFGEPDKLDDMIDGRTAETCNVYNMIKMTRALFALDPQIRYADFHERALFNHILGSMDPADGATCYMVPVGQGVVREYQDMQEDFTCCVGSGMESHALHGYGLYYESGDTLWVNVYAPSTAVWTAAGVRLTMTTSFPEGEAAGLALEMKKPRRFTIALRRPFWAGEGFSVTVNGVPVKDPGPAGSYVRLDRKWKTGDNVALVLPKALRLEPLPDNPARAAIMWGPLVLAGDLGPIPPRRSSPESGTPSAKGTPQWPTAPVLVTAEASPDAWIQPVAGRPGVFRTEGVGRDADVDLVPFYRLHRRVYAAYWDILTPGEWEERAAAMKAAEEARRKLESATVAFAQPGQMQSERDFNQQGGKTSPVQLRGRYGRRAVDWFSFDLEVDPSAQISLIVTYSRDERADRAFAVLVDGRKVGDERISRRSPQEKEGFFDVTYPVPAEAVAGKRKVTVRFEGVDGLETGTVFGIRIVRTQKNTVTFVGISGFLIEVDGKKVLIDGLSNFTPPAVEQRVLAGEAPFDGLDLVMATHSHGDHFKAALVGRCLQNHPKAAFVAPTDAADQVSGFPGRVFPVQANEGKRTLLEVNGIRIQAMPLSHGTPPPGVPAIVNLGYLVTIGSVTFFHTGDIDPSQLTPELLRALGLPEERIDFAFVPGFFLAMPEPPPFVTKGIRPRVFIAAHLPPAGQEPLDYAAIRRNFPTAVLVKSELESWTIK